MIFKTQAYNANVNKKRLSQEAYFGCALIINAHNCDVWTAANLYFTIILSRKVKQVILQSNM